LFLIGQARRYARVRSREGVCAGCGRVIVEGCGGWERWGSGNVWRKMGGRGGVTLGAVWTSAGEKHHGGAILVAVAWEMCADGFGYDRAMALRSFAPW